MLSILISRDNKYWTWALKNALLALYCYNDGSKEMVLLDVWFG